MDAGKFRRGLCCGLWTAGTLFAVTPAFCQPIPDRPESSPVIADSLPAHFPAPAPQFTILPPELKSFQINLGASSTSEPQVTLNNQTIVGASVALGRARLASTHYRASEDPGFYGAEWLSYNSAPLFTLSQGTGEKTVYLQVGNLDPNSPVTPAYSSVHCDSIRVLDQGGREEFNIAGGDVYAMGAAYGFGVSARPLDPTSVCNIVGAAGNGAFDFQSYGQGFPDTIFGSRCEFSFFGQRELQNNWAFKSYVINSFHCSGNDAGHRVELAPVEGSRSIAFRIRTWSNSATVCHLNLAAIKLEGPQEAEWVEAFR